MKEHRVRRGLDIPLAGRPASEVAPWPDGDTLRAERFIVYPDDYPGLKLKPAVKEGEKVRNGDPLLVARNLEGFCSKLRLGVRET